MFTGRTLSLRGEGPVVEVELHRPPANEIGSETLEDLERLVDTLGKADERIRALVLHSRVPAGFSAGADLRELYERAQKLTPAERRDGVGAFLRRIHAVMSSLDGAPFVTVAAVHGVVFGGGWELALTCDLVIADATARFGFPELRLGLIPGFGGIPRLSRDVGGAVVRDLLLTGRSLGAKRALALGLVSQMTAPGQALDVARRAAEQAAKFDSETARAAKRFLKPVPPSDLDREIEVFLQLFDRALVEDRLRRFVESDDPLPYLP